MRKWEVWEAYVPYEDKCRKGKRPVIIIDEGVVLTVVLKVTTHQRSGLVRPFEYEVNKCAEAGLQDGSVVQCEKYRELDNTAFTGKQYGRLSTTDIVGLSQMMKYHGLVK